jgi:integrase
MARARKRQVINRGYGRGVIEETTEGRFRGRIQLNGLRRAQTYDTVAEADDYLDKLLDGVAPNRDMTLGEWLELWLADFAPRPVSEDTWANRRWAVDAFKPLHGVKLRLLRPEQVADVLSKLAKDGGGAKGRGLSKRSLTIIRGVLRASLRTALGQGRVPFNAADDVQIPDKARAKRQRRSLTKAERDAVMAVVAGTDLQAAAALGFALALRPGEICSLLWIDVDFKARLVKVVRSRRGGPKRGSKGALRMSPELAALLRECQRRQKAARIKAGARWHETGLVVTTRVGKALDKDNFRNRLRQACKKAGVEPITPYELRHTAATLLRERGAQPHEVRAVMRHKDLRLVMTDYYHDTFEVAEASGDWS